MDLPPIPASEQLIEQAPRGLTALAGLALNLAGARLYPVAVMAPGFALGVAGAMAIPYDFDPKIRLGGVLVAGLVGALICRFVERLAIAAAGVALMMGATWVGWPLLFADGRPWWLPLVGAGLGIFLFPRVYQAALKPITALLGAEILAISLGQQDKWWLVLALAGLGALVQSGLGGSGGGKSADKVEKKKKDKKK